MIEKVVSGGQTGVDRAALDAARAADIACGGWCPRGRRAEDGPIPGIYPLRETPGNEYIERTRLNVEGSDGTLVITRGRPTGGTQRTVRHAGRIGKPVNIVDLDHPLPEAIERVGRWLSENGIQVMNVAGPRESTIPGIYEAANAFLHSLFADLRQRR